jgi:addiction module RelE/StbE family toxin
VKVRWSPEAKHDLTDIVNYIWVDSPAAAKRMNALQKAAAFRLEAAPFMGRPGAISGMRELIPHPSYRFVYEIRKDIVWIAAPFHTSRQWPPVEDEH